MTFESKISGTKVTDFEITPIFDSQIVWLSDAMAKIQKQEVMDYLLDYYRFTRGFRDKTGDWDWCAIIDWDSIYKLSTLENYPEYEKEFIGYFGEDWLKHYIRFNH